MPSERRKRVEALDKSASEGSHGKALAAQHYPAVRLYPTVELREVVSVHRDECPAVRSREPELFDVRNATTGHPSFGSGKNIVASGPKHHCDRKRDIFVHVQEHSGVIVVGAQGLVDLRSVGLVVGPRVLQVFLTHRRVVLEKFAVRNTLLSPSNQQPNGDPGVTDAGAATDDAWRLSDSLCFPGLK